MLAFMSLSFSLAASKALIFLYLFITKLLTMDFTHFFISDSLGPQWCIPCVPNVTWSSPRHCLPIAKSNCVIIDTIESEGMCIKTRSWTHWLELIQALRQTHLLIIFEEPAAEALWFNQFLFLVLCSYWNLAESLLVMASVETLMIKTPSCTEGRCRYTQHLHFLNEFASNWKKHLPPPSTKRILATTVSIASKRQTHHNGSKTRSKLQCHFPWPAARRTGERLRQNFKRHSASSGVPLI